MAERASGMAVPSVVCLALAAGLLFVLLPRGFTLGGIRLDVLVQLALMAGAVAAGAWGAFSGKERRVALGSLLAFGLLTPAYDPRAPLERLPLYIVVGALLVLHVELALLHAKMTKLAKLPRAHLTQVGQSREVDLRSTASRIAQSWPTPLAMGAGIVGLALGVQFLLTAVAPRSLADSVELRGPFGLALGALVVFTALGAFAWTRRAPQEGGEPGPPPLPSSGEGSAGGEAGSS